MKKFFLSIFLCLFFLPQISNAQPIDFEFLFGSFGSGDGQLNVPLSMAVDSMSNMYVADTSNSRIQVFDSSGNFQFMFGWGVDDGANAFQICNSSCQAGITGSGDGQFLFPTGIAVDSMNNIYVVDLFNDRIQVFDSSGNFQFMFGWGVDDGANAFQICNSSCQAGISGSGEGQFDNPREIAVDSMSNIYISDDNNERIQVFDSSANFQFMFGWGVDDGANAFQICNSSCQAGISGSGDGQFNTPRGISVDSMKNIYVTDTSNHRIQVFNSAGNFLLKFGTLGTGDGQLTFPRDVAVDSMKNIYVTDFDNDRIQLFDSSGNFQSMFGWGVEDGANAFQNCNSSCQIGISGSGNGQFNLPRGISVDSMKNIYVADSDNSRIQVFSQAQPGAVISLSPSTAINEIRTDHTVTALVLREGNQLTNTLVTFEVTSGPNAGQVSNPDVGECNPDNCETDAEGQVTWTYSSEILGTDMIISSFFDDETDMTVESNIVSKIWILPSRNIPTMSEWGMIAMTGILGIVGLIATMRRRTAAA